MISVTVFAVVFENEYEFRLDEDARISELLEEIGEMICQKEQCLIKGDPSSLILFKRETAQVFPHDSTLSECGVMTGDVLYLV